MLDLIVTLIIFPLVVRILATIFEKWFLNHREDD